MSNGGRYFNEEYGGEVYYDTPSMLGAAQFVEDLVFKHKVMQQGVVEGGGVSTNFLAGKVSMMLLSTGWLSFVRENMKLPYDVAFVPSNVRNAVPIGGGSLVMFKGLTRSRRRPAGSSSSGSPRPRRWAAGAASPATSRRASRPTTPPR